MELTFQWGRQSEEDLNWQKGLGAGRLLNDSFNFEKENMV